VRRLDHHAQALQLGERRAHHVALGAVVLHQVVLDEPRARQDDAADDVGLDGLDDCRDLGGQFGPGKHPRVHGGLPVVAHLNVRALLWLRPGA